MCIRDRVVTAAHAMNGEWITAFNVSEIVSDMEKKCQCWTELIQKDIEKNKAYEELTKAKKLSDNVTLASSGNNTYYIKITAINGMESATKILNMLHEFNKSEKVFV